MTTSQADSNGQPVHHRARPLGVRGRLLLAFFAIAGFAVLAAAAGIYAFREVGERLDVVDARAAPALAALELSRSAERIIAAAPALLVATERTRRDLIKSNLEAEVEELNKRLLELKKEAEQAPPLDRIEPLVTALTRNLAALEDVVAQRAEASDRIGALRHKVFETSGEIQRLLAPWLEVIGGQISALLRDGRGTDPETAQRLESFVQLQRTTQAAQRQVSAAADLLTEASTAEQASRLPILEFQLRLALRDLVETAASLDPKLQALFLEQVAKLRQLAEGPNAMTETRKQELALLAEGERLLSETGRVSAQLSAAVDQLGSAAKQDIGEAIRAALSVQRISGSLLVALVVLSLLTSVLIVWLYVGGNIVRRLTGLSSGMLAIAGGKLQAPMTVEGDDEIAAMARAVEVFRRNTVERDELLAEKAQAAERLEEEVKQRTRELRDALVEIREKSRELEIANRYKSHFLASASHDLRQPLHALNLFVAQLRAEADPAERTRLVARIDAATSAMNELFESLLDMSKLEAGILEPHFTDFPVQRVLKLIETTFADTAREKGLRLAVVPSSAWVRSDFILLERILMNLVSNAVRYTTSGGIVVGCRRRESQIRLDVCDSGPGIAPEQQADIFGEYYRIPADQPERGGLGLGLAIVERLGRLLDHGIELNSLPGRGSRFSVLLARVPERRDAADASIPPTIADPARGKLVLVIDDDPLVLDGMSAILRGWGCHVLSASSEEAALSRIAAQRARPDLIIADYRLANGGSGSQAIEHLRAALGVHVPAFLISGDTAPERLRDASESGFHLLHKPVAPMRLRAMLHQLLRTSAPGASRAAAE